MTARDHSPASHSPTSHASAELLALQRAAEAFWRHSRDCARWGLCADATEARHRALTLRVRHLLLDAGDGAEYAGGKMGDR